MPIWEVCKIEGEGGLSVREFCKQEGESILSCWELGKKVEKIIEYVGCCSVATAMFGLSKLNKKKGGKKENK